jgi:hypothetical protein
MELPRCKRCEKKNIECSYSNNKVTVADNVIPELDFSWLDKLLDDPNMPPWSGQLQPQLDTALDGAYSGGSHLDPLVMTSPEPWDSTITESSPCTHTPHAEIHSALHHFQTWPDKWIKEGKAPFIHPQLYTAGMPRPLQDAYAACAVYATKTKQNENIAFTVIESKANELLHSSKQPDWSLLELLAAVQALLIFQFIRLLDGNIRQRASAETAEPILRSWTKQLKAKSTVEQAYTTDTAPSWYSWVFGESIRRTTTMGVFLEGAYSLEKQGFCTLGRQVTANSFTAQRRLWESQGPLEWERVRKTYDSFWVSLMDFDRVIRDCRSEELDDFGMVLLICYKGQDVVDHWVITSQSVQYIVTDDDLHCGIL